MTVSWNAVSGVNSYTVYWNTTGSVTTAAATLSPGTSTQIVHTPLSNGTTRYYRVVATNNTGPSVLSSEVSATPMAPPPPTSPQNVSASAGNGQVTVSWNAVSGANSYTVYWDTTGGVTTADATLSPGASTQIRHAPLSNGTTRFYRVVATNNSGSSVLSSEVSATSMAPPVPTSPQNVSANAGDEQVTVSWNAVSGANSYTVYWDTTGGVTTLDATLNPGASTRIVHTPLSNGTTRFYRVVATNGSGSSALSSEVSATPEPLENGGLDDGGLDDGGGSFGLFSTWLMLMLALFRQIRVRKLDRKVKFTLFG